MVIIFNIYLESNSLLLSLSVLPVIRANWRDHVRVLFKNAKECRDELLDTNNCKSGIYIWINNLNDKIYIGQASDLGG